MLRLEGVTLAVGGRDLLVGADWELHPGQRVGLVGRNGVGKTTFLRALAGELSVDAGRLERRPGLRVGWLPQHARHAADAPLWDEARAGMTRLLAMEAEVAAAQAAVEGGAARGPERLARATEAFRVAGGYAMDERVGTVLHGLGFSAADWKKPCAAFSGGWQVRAALARMLLSEPELLLLDEPTNHLDLHARAWLEQYLDAYPHSVVLVSHDRRLLDRACTAIVELRSRRLHTFVGNFSAWRKERALRHAQAEAAFDAQQEEIARLERFVERFKATATKATQAASRQKALDRMERLDAPDREHDVVLRLAAAPPCSEEAVVLEGAAVGYAEGAPVLRGVELSLQRGWKVAVLGVNGGGKSTLLHALSGRLPLAAGRRRLGRGVRLGLFTQDLARELDPTRTAFEIVRDEAPMADETRVRGALGALGLSGEAALRPAGVLSGGEKARVVLAGFAVKPVNVLLLDEPTNHLDVETVELLIEALRDWEGALLFVTHDRHLVEALATHVVHVRDGAVEMHPGVRPEDFLLEPTKAAAEAATAPARASSHEERKAAARERERVERRIARLPAEIEAAEAALAEVDDALCAPGLAPARFAELARAREAAEARVGGLYAEWEALESARA
jgi:ATP-binding cassette subfamily F protein 3